MLRALLERNELDSAKRSWMIPAESEDEDDENDDLPDDSAIGMPARKRAKVDDGSTVCVRTCSTSLTCTASHEAGKRDQDQGGPPDGDQVFVRLCQCVRVSPYGLMPSQRSGASTSASGSTTQLARITGASRSVLTLLTVQPRRDVLEHRQMDAGAADQVGHVRLPHGR